MAATRRLIGRSATRRVVAMGDRPIFPGEKRTISLSPSDTPVAKNLSLLGGFDAPERRTPTVLPTTRKATSAQRQFHPAVVSELRRRRDDIQLRIADSIIAFAGSMQFVYLHAALFAAWTIWLEKHLWPTLTLFVSLEEIFLSTFVMIGQNRQSAFAQEKANHDFHVAEQDLHEDTELTRLVHDLLVEIRNGSWEQAERAVEERTGVGGGE